MIKNLYLHAKISKLCRATHTKQMTSYVVGRKKLTELISSDNILDEI